MVTPDRRITPAPADFEKILDLAADLTLVIGQLLLSVLPAWRLTGHHAVGRGRFMGRTP
jgi:hypothetical protein